MDKITKILLPVLAVMVGVLAMLAVFSPDGIPLAEHEPPKDNLSKETADRRVNDRVAIFNDRLFAMKGTIIAENTLLMNALKYNVAQAENQREVNAAVDEFSASLNSLKTGFEEEYRAMSVPFHEHIRETYAQCGECSRTYADTYIGDVTAAMEKDISILNRLLDAERNVVESVAKERIAEFVQVET